MWSFPFIKDRYKAGKQSPETVSYTHLDVYKRQDLTELAVILGVEEVDVVNELAAREAEGIICGYHTLIDWDKTSLDKISALIEVRVTPQRGQGFDNIAERVYKYPEVNAVYLISGGFDLLVTLEGRNLKEISLSLIHI